MSDYTIIENLSEDEINRFLDIVIPKLGTRNIVDFINEIDGR